MKVILTNWINLAGILSTTTIFWTITMLSKMSNNVFAAMLLAFLAVLSYGMIFWIPFILLLVILDRVLIVSNCKNLKVKLIAEWLIISSPFIYWSITYNEYIFTVAIVTFFITQMLRKKRIIQIIVGTDTDQ